MKDHPDIAALLAAWSDPPGGDSEARERISATVAALRRLRRDRPDLFEAEAARRVRPAADDAPAPAERARAGSLPGIRVSSSPEAVLREVFGFDAFRPGQGELVAAVLAGRDAIGVLPTGSGKSLTYQLPARLLGGTTLVVSPLIALMKDQVDAMAPTGLRATFLNSSLDPEERRRRVEGVRRGEYELVYAAPEGLEGSAGAALAGGRLALLAVDEAHCISHWGHDFRPAYRKLAGLRERFGRVPVLALTATATRRVSRDIVEQLGMRDPFEYRGSFFRANLRLRAVKKGEGARSREEILALVRARRGESGIVYCTARRSAESLAEFLRSKRVRAMAYHAGLETGERERVQDAFHHGEADVVVATVAFGMGIDKPDIRYVIHRDMPGSVEGYTQEIGRAGRDGEPSDCVLFYSWADVMAHDRLGGDAEDPELARFRRQQARRMLEFAEAPGCRHRLLAAHFDERIDPCGTACDRCDAAMASEARRAGEAAPSGRSRLRKAPASGRARGVGPEAGRPGPLFDDTAPDAEALLLRLKAWRRRAAQERGTPPFLVFPDAALKAIAAARPRTPDELGGVKGVGPAKLATFGAQVLAEIAAHGADGEAAEAIRGELAGG